MRRMLAGLLLLASCGGPEPNLASGDAYERYLGAKELAVTRDFRRLLPILEDKHYLAVLGALEAIAEIGEPHALQHVVPQLKHDHPLVRRQACLTAGALRNEEGIAALSGTLKDADPAVRREAAKALGRFGRRDDVTAALLGALDDPDPSVVLMAHNRLAELTGIEVRERRRQAWEKALKPP